MCDHRFPTKGLADSFIEQKRAYEYISGQSIPVSTGRGLRRYCERTTGKLPVLMEDLPILPFLCLNSSYSKGGMD
jgi:hypothetical protein